MLRGRAEFDPFVAEAGHDAARDHAVERPPAHLVADAMMEVAARADFLNGGEIAALMMHARESVAHELLRDVCDALTLSLIALCRCECRTLADAVEHVARAIGHSAVEIARLVSIEGAAGRIRRVLRDLRELERLRVVERRVAAAMTHDDWMLGRNFIEVVTVERPFVLELRVVVEVALDPGARRSLLRFGAKLLDDAVDGDEFDLERIADEYFVQQRRAARMVVCVDEPGHDGHLLCVERLRLFADQSANIG